MQSDDALRSAYADAVNAGVNGRALSPLRNRWARLRRSSLVDPDGVADGYRQLARELRALHPRDAEADESRIADGY